LSEFDSKPSGHTKLAQVSTQQLLSLKSVEFTFYRAKFNGQIKSAQVGIKTQQLLSLRSVESRFCY
jgi:hypothetical protein